MAADTVHLPNKTAYDLWAPTYDNDGNILQSLDSLGLQNILLPRLLSSIKDNAQELHENSDPLPPLTMIDLGCGTGRTILAFLSGLQNPQNRQASAHALVYRSLNVSFGREVHIKGLDTSEGMLKIAKSNPQLPPERTLTLAASQDLISTAANNPSTDLTVRTSFSLYDIQAPLDPATSPPAADIIICSLVLEHLPSVPSFFIHLIDAKLIKPSGLLLLSNMHPDMAKGATIPSFSSGASADAATPGERLVSGAGFKDLSTGSKIRAADDWAHTIPEVLEAATAKGFELVGDHMMEEMRVEEWMLEEGVVDRRRGEKWAKGGVLCWFGGVFRYVGKR